MLDDRALGKSTVVFFLSDNGGLENYDLDLGGHVTSNAPLRGEKGTLFEGGIRTPMMVRWPGRVSAGSSTGDPAAARHLLPTLADLANAPTSGVPLDGISFAPVLLGSSAARTAADDRRLIFHYPNYHHDRPASAVVTSRWKLIEFLDDGETRLFDLAADVGESSDIGDAIPDVRRELSRALEKWRHSVAARLPVHNSNHDPARAGEYWHPYRNEPIDAEFLRRLLKPGDN